jgi:hypothetical protein
MEILWSTHRQRSIGAMLIQLVSFLCSWSYLLKLASVQLSDYHWSLSWINFLPCTEIWLWEFQLLAQGWEAVMMRGSVWQRLLCLTIIGSMALVIHLAGSDLYSFCCCTVHFLFSLISNFCWKYETWEVKIGKFTFSHLQILYQGSKSSVTTFCWEGCIKRRGHSLSWFATGFVTSSSCKPKGMFP